MVSLADIIDHRENVIVFLESQLKLGFVLEEKLWITLPCI